MENKSAKREAMERTSRAFYLSARHQKATDLLILTKTNSLDLLEGHFHPPRARENRKFKNSLSLVTME